VRTAAKTYRIRDELSKMKQGYRQAQALMAFATVGWTSLFAHLTHNAIEKGHVIATGVGVVWGGTMAIGGIGIMMQLRSERKLEIAHILRGGRPKGGKVAEEPKRMPIDKPRGLEGSKA